MPVKRLRKLLDEQGVEYDVISHSPAATAQEIAASAHVPGRELAKTVIVELDGRMAMVVLPASTKVDFHLLARATKAKNVRLADESEFESMFPGCELGAMPPFGNLYGMDTYVALTLTKDEEIAFNAGSHTELIRLAYADFERLVQPTVIEFAIPAGV